MKNVRKAAIHPSTLSVTHAPALLRILFDINVAEAERDVGVEREVGALAGLEFDCAGGGDHGGVVGREMRRREIDGDGEPRARLSRSLAQSAVASDAARDDERAWMMFEREPFSRADERAHDDRLKTRGQSRSKPARRSLVRKTLLRSAPRHS